MEKIDFFDDFNIENFSYLYIKSKNASHIVELLATRI